VRPMCVSRVCVDLNSLLSFHRFPKQANLRKAWIGKIRHVGLIATPNTRVCNRHFESARIRTLPSGKRSLLPNAVPTLFRWNNCGEAKGKRTGIWERRPRPNQNDMAQLEEDVSAASGSPLAVDLELPQEVPSPVPEDHDCAASSFLVLDRIKYENMVKEIEDFHQQVQSLQLTQTFGLERFRHHQRIHDITQGNCFFTSSHPL
uniref:THAP domain-containing protein 1 n=1 Tax=Nothobranchius furzeri TaxID=105023 RepID=A0A8C6LY32_NOTFU